MPVSPAICGGANWPPSSYDPASGYLYVCAQDRVGTFRADENRRRAAADRRRATSAASSAGTPLTILGVFAALDMRTNKLVWQQHWPDPCYSGSTVTAGGLVFVGRNDGRLTALTRATARSFGSSRPARA